MIHIFDVFAMQITLRLLLICDSYPLFLCRSFLPYIFSYSVLVLVLVLTCSLFCPYCHSRCERLSNYSLSIGRLLYSFIFVPISYIFFSLTGYWVLEESSETIFLFVDSRGSEVGHVPLDVRNDVA